MHARWLNDLPLAYSRLASDGLMDGNINDKGPGHGNHFNRQPRRFRPWAIERAKEIVANEASDLAVSVRDGDEAGIRDAGNALGAAIAAALLEVYDGLISEE